MQQFFLDVFWFGNTTFFFSLMSIVIGLVLILFCVHLLLTSAMLLYKPKAIAQIQVKKPAVAFGRITAEAPFEWNGIQCAYFSDSRTEKEHPANNQLCIQDASGSMTIDLKDADINVTEVTEADGTISYIEQDTECFVRGYVTADREFKTTYAKVTPDLDTESPKAPIIDHPLELQKDSFVRNIRDAGIMIVMVLFTIVAVFEAYPLYSYHQFWTDNIDDVVESRTSLRGGHYIRLHEEDMSLKVSDELYESCEPGIRFTKPTNSLDLGCGDNPDELYTKNRPLSEQLLLNWSWFLLAFLWMGLTIMTKLESNKNRA